MQAGQGDEVFECGYEGMTALMMTSALGLVEIVEKRLKNGANPDVIVPATEWEPAETALAIAQKRNELMRRHQYCFGGTAH